MQGTKLILRYLTHFNQDVKKLDCFVFTMVGSIVYHQPGPNSIVTPMKLLRTIFFTILISSPTLLSATHIRGGYINVERVEERSFTYVFTFTGYRDNHSGVTFGEGFFDFGDGTISDGNFFPTETEIHDDLTIVQFSAVHTYSGPGAYTVGYSEPFRNEDIVNMESPFGVPFYVETFFVTDPLVGASNSGTLENIPIFLAEVGKAYFFTPIISDPDDDRIAFRLARPRRANDEFIPGHTFPHNEQFYSDAAHANQTQDGHASLSMDPSTGTMIWDSPGDLLSSSGVDCPEGYSNCSEYSLAFFFEEYRMVGLDDVLMSRTLVDFQVIVSSPSGDGPEIPKVYLDYVPCITPSETLNFSISSNAEYSWEISSDLNLLINGNNYVAEDYHSLTGSLAYEISVADFASESTAYLEVFPLAHEENPEGPGRIAHGAGVSGPSASIAFEIAESCPEIPLNIEKAQYGITIYPNPVQNLLRISGQRQYQTFVIYNLDGKILKRSAIDGSSINVSELSQGHFLLMLQSPDGSLQQFRFYKE